MLDQPTPIQAMALYAIILVEGFITISIEILTIRQVIPFVGNSITVTSLIIGIFLLFLAYGYKKGGTYQEQLVKVLSKNFTISAFLLGIGLSYVFLDLFFITFSAKVSSNLLLGLTCYLLVITAPLIYFLGQTVPITMNLLYQDRSMGSRGGNILHLSTIGSFLGALLTTLLLMHIFGIANSIFINYCLLFGLVFLISMTFKFNLYLLIVLTVTSIFVYKLNTEFEHLAFVKTNNYANYSILKTNALYNRAGKVLNINGSNSSYTDDLHKAFPYVEKIKDLLFHELKLRNKNILVLGAGGFTLSSENTFENQFTYVDIDPDLKNIVSQHFIPNIQGKLITSDARLFVLQNDTQWDVIVLDTYSNNHEIPTHLVTREYFQVIYNRVKPGGYVVFNVIGQPTLENVYSKRVDNTIRAVFKDCMVMPIHYTDELANIIYACHVGSQKADETVYVDNNNQAEIDVSKKS